MTDKENHKLNTKESSELKSLEEALQRLHMEVNFGSNAFKGNVEQVQDLMDNTTKSLTSEIHSLKKLLETYQEISKKLNDQIATLSLLPSKTKESLTKLVPAIGTEIEKIHYQRMTTIETNLKSLQEDLNEDAENQLNILKDLSEQLQKQFNENALDKQKSLEQITLHHIEQINQVQLKQITQQEEMFKQVVHHTQKEIESVTSNHGTKFLRNTASCLILAAIIGGISGWYINRYLPKFVTLEKTGNITIHHSNVRVLETGKVSNDN